MALKIWMLKPPGCIVNERYFVFIQSDSSKLILSSVSLNVETFLALWRWFDFFSKRRVEISGDLTTIVQRSIVLDRACEPSHNVKEVQFSPRTGVLTL